MQIENQDRTLYEWIALRCQSGEADAFEDLVAAMGRPLLYYAASLTGSQDSGLDVLRCAPRFSCSQAQSTKWATLSAATMLIF
jgi:hypothetical protein